MNRNARVYHGRARAAHAPFAFGVNAVEAVNLCRRWMEDAA
jgi:hypothetical protein